ncbi:MAG: hypothetical protein EHM30_03170 [Desulfobacteraceae bacterium]|nr:MAG: hypothetical protein EHM30_03170 [Desulfobacteraceae bacterium]
MNFKIIHLVALFSALLLFPFAACAVSDRALNKAIWLGVSAAGLSIIICLGIWIWNSIKKVRKKSVKELSRYSDYYAPKITQSNEEFIALFKSTVNENRFETIPDEDLVKICKRARLVNAQSKKTDPDFIMAINKV